MKQVLFLLVIVFLGIKLSFAQDGVFKFKEIHVSFAEIHQKDHLQSIELYYTSPLIFVPSNQLGYHAQAKYDSLEHLYTIQFSYTGIGGGSNNRMVCPMLWLKLKLLSNEQETYFQLIPLSLAICEASDIREITVLDIDLHELLLQDDKMILIRENNKYEVVEREKMNLGKFVRL